MASFSQSPNSLPVSDSALPLRLLLFPSPSPSPSHLPASTTASLPSSPPSTDPPPATVPSPSRLPISAPPPTASPPTLSSTPPSSPLPPPTNTPLPPSSPSSPSPPTSSPPPPSLIPPADPPPPPSSPSPPASSPPPPSLIPPTVSPLPPSSPSPPATSPPPPLSPHVFPPKPPSNPSRGSPPLPSFSPPPFPPPPLSPHVFPPKPPSSPSRGSPPLPSFSPPPPRNTSVTPKKSPSIPPGPILSPPPHTPLSLRPSRNSSSPLVIVASPPPFKQPAPSPSEVVILHPGSPSNTNRPSSNGGIATGGIVGITAVLGILLLTTIITVSWCLYKRNKKIAGHNEQLHGLSTSMDSLPQSSLLKIQASAAEIGIISGNDLGYSHSRSKFTYEDLYEATNGFSPQNLLGSGGFGYVYKGFLVDGTEVAVKELKIGGGQGEREFSAEVEIISRIHHRYLVSLVGYCVSENKRLLVYEYVPNNTLYYHLHVSELVLDWPTRVRVASGAARGIAYLHEDCHPRVIHRDIKSSNILLDKNFEARVSDFGLAKLAADVHTHVTTRVMGTFGYMAPEYARSGNLSEKSDVFSFGVVLLELITGRKPVDASQPWGDEGLVEWSRPLLSHALETEDFKLLVDPRLGINFVPNEMFRMIEAAAACIRHSAIKRPRMGQIVRAFENLETEDLNNGMRVGESEIYNSAQQSAEIKLFQRMAFGSRNYSTDYFTQSSWATNSTDW